MTCPLDELGGEDALRILIDAFYDRMERDPRAHAILRLHFRGYGLDHTRQTQFEFMSGFLGGRAYYRERFGHMDLREIHAHIPIRMADATLWLETFDAALDEVGLAGPVIEKMRATLSRAAHMLVNDVHDWREGEDVSQSTKHRMRDYGGLRRS